MDTNKIIIAMLIACGVLTGLVILARPIKALFRLFFKTVLGSLILYCINSIFGSLGFFVGINPFTAVFSGILGMPGIAALYIIGMLLN